MRARARACVCVCARECVHMWASVCVCVCVCACRRTGGGGGFKTAAVWQLLPGGLFQPLKAPKLYKVSEEFYVSHCTDTEENPKTYKP